MPRISTRPLVARLEAVPGHDITSEWQRCDLFGNGETTAITVDDGDAVLLATEGLRRLMTGLHTLGIAAQHFPWPPADDPKRAPYWGGNRCRKSTRRCSSAATPRSARYGPPAPDACIGCGLDAGDTGPLRCGKSSFLRAGLLPRVRRDDREFVPMAIVRPERAVLTGDTGLASSIHGLRTALGMDTPLLGTIKQACRDADPTRLRGWLAEAREAARDRLVDHRADDSRHRRLCRQSIRAKNFQRRRCRGSRTAFLEILAALLGDGQAASPGCLSR